VRGEVVYLFLFDTGSEVKLEQVGELLNKHPDFAPFDIHKLTPRYVNLPKPLRLNFAPILAETNLGTLQFEMTARIYEIGAVAFTLRTRFEVAEVADLIPLGRLRLKEPGGDVSLETLCRGYFEEMLAGMRDALVEPYDVVAEPETYTVYVITEGVPDVDFLLAEDPRAMAALLSGERSPERLGPEEVNDNLRYWYRYFENDLVVVDWEYALVVEPTGRYEDVLSIFELANLQLLELRVYDHYLDTVLDKAYDDLEDFFSRGGIFKSARDVQIALAEARIDLTRVTESIDNIGKIFGDWYLAKLYLGVSERFHLKDWEKTVQDKLEAVEKLYALATHEVEHRRAVLLESLIVLLFVLDLLLIFLVSI